MPSKVDTKDIVLSYPAPIADLMLSRDVSSPAEAIEAKYSPLERTGSFTTPVVIADSFAAF